jgi:hypothetical protein
LRRRHRRRDTSAGARGKIAKASPLQHLFTASHSFRTGTVLMENALYTITVIAAELHCVAAKNKVRRADKKARNTLGATGNH